MPWGGRFCVMIGVQDVGLWTEALSAYDVVVRAFREREGAMAGAVRLVMVVRNPLPGDVHPKDQEEGVALPREVVLDWASWREVELARSQPLEDKTIELLRIVLLQGSMDVIGLDGGRIPEWRVPPAGMAEAKKAKAWKNAPLLLCRARVESEPAVVPGHDDLMKKLDARLRAA